LASGNTLVIFTPLANEPPSANYATLDLRNYHPVLDFDADADEAAVFTGVLPRAYAGGGVTVYLHWAATSATSGNVVWDVSFERIGDDVLDIDSDSFAAVQSVTAAASGTSGNVVIDTIAFTNGAQMDSVAAGEAFRLKINRDANNANDTMTGDAELVAVEIKET
jgi:hypothetical protein